MEIGKRNTFRRRERLKKYRDILQVLRKGENRSDDLLNIRLIQNFRDCSRLAVMTPKKLGIAVKRNRWRRMVREAFRLLKSSLKWNIDLVVRPLVPPEKIKTPEVEKRLRHAIRDYLRPFEGSEERRRKA